MTAAQADGDTQPHWRVSLLWGEDWTRRMERMDEGVRIAIVGMGGIGSHLLRSLAPALHSGRLSRSLGGVSLHIFDSDSVGESNLMHQSFAPSDVGRKKVDAIRDSMGEFLGESLEIVSRPVDVRSPLDGYGFVIVCVDSDEARRAVHGSGSPWLDLRCIGDGFIAIDHRVKAEVVDSLTSNTGSASCQLEGSLEDGNIQFGYMASAAHGAQWAIQMLRIFDGQDGVMLPAPSSSSITFGTLGRLPVEGDGLEAS
ncbi:MAG: hypothetical protein CL386_10910 [Acidiferrobacter sp.]|nr:hypothetical protein [Acidiferrobacter sp.]